MARFGDDATVHRTLFPAIPAEWRDADLRARFERVRAVRRIVTASLEAGRKRGLFGSSLAAAVTLPLAPAEEADFADVDWADLASVSQFAVAVAPDIAPLFGDGAGSDGPAGTHPGPTVDLAPGRKCARCWRVLPEVGTDRRHEALCLRCVDAVGV